MNQRSILIAGMGQGGMVAAIKLGEAGYKVDVFEKAAKGKVSYDWTDDMVKKPFETLGIPLPPKESYSQMNSWYWVTPDGKTRIQFPANGVGNDISVERHDLCDHFAALAEATGNVTIHYEETVKELILEKDMVVGFTTDKGTYKGDLVIDACGIHSPLRRQIPDKFMIQVAPAADDNMLAYRAFYEMNPDYDAPVYPQARSCMYLKHMGGAGLSWCNLSPHNEVDIFIGRIGGLTKEEAEEMEADLFEKHADMLTHNVVYPGKWVSVNTRYTISRMVADGYALVGESAFMSIPIMGSGIESAMNAGVLLAEAIIDAGDAKLDVKHLWPYQVAFYKKLGAIFALIDVLKRWVLNIDGEVADWALGHVAGPQCIEPLTFFLLDEMSLVKMLSKFIPNVVKAVPKLFERPAVIRELLGVVGQGIKAFLVALTLPKKYKQRKVDRWTRRYEACFPHEK